MSGMTLTVLGCSGSYPGPSQAASGYLVEVDGFHLLIDCGSGVAARLQEHISLGDVDAVVLSHCHPDHWVDLMSLRTAWRYALGREGVPVFGTAETLEMVEAIAQSGAAPTLEWKVVSDGSEAEVGPLRLRFARTEHYVETLAVRIDHQDATVVYSADTGDGWTMRDLADSPHLALVESSFLERSDAERVLHLTPAEAARIAREARARRLVLTHLLPGEDPVAHLAAAREVFDGPVDVAAPDRRWMVES